MSDYSLDSVVSQPHIVVSQPHCVVSPPVCPQTTPPPVVVPQNVIPHRLTRKDKYHMDLG
jgi:hypothetical protein